MSIKTSTHRQKQTSPGPDSSNCNSSFGVFKIGLVIRLCMAAPYAYLVLSNLVNLTHIDSYNNRHSAAFSMYLSVGYDMVKHAKYRC